MGWGTGSGGAAATQPTLAQVSVTHPAVAATVAVTGTTDPDLNPVTYVASFVEVLNEFSQQYLEGTKLEVQADGRIKALVDCKVHVDGYLDLTHSVNNATAGAAFVVTRGGTPVLTARTVHSKMPNAGDIGHLSGNGMVTLLAGDIFGLALASDLTGTLDIKSSTLTFTAY